jgi:LPXTG-motif cell wall-anchored protein
MMRRNSSRIAVLCLVLGAGLVTPGILWAADEIPTTTTQTTEPATGAETPPPTTTEAAPPSTTDQPPPTATKAAKPAPAPKPHASPAPVARAAASGGVSIQGFAFHPGSMTVNVGDSVTWTNQDSVAHTATANDGSFDTGTLKRGQSGSHTFNQAGTFSYICSIHPNMHGTVTVVGSASGSSSGSGSGSSSSGSSGTTGTASSSSTGSSLPNTGLQIGAVALLGLALLGAGGLLRRASRRFASDD